MTSVWRSYVPYHVVQDILRHPQTNPVEREQRFNTVALFADVSGFTAISEALGKTGKAGTEELTIILNSYFDPMIALIHSYGGIIGKFGGDAMTILFPYTQRTQQATVRRALQCALEMQANMHRYEAMPTSAGPFNLAMKAGLAMGPILCTTVGDPATRLEYIIAGLVLDLCAEAEHHATKGEVVAHNEMLTHAGLVQIAEERASFSCLAGLKRRPKPVPLPTLSKLPAMAIKLLMSYLHPVIAARLQTGQSGFVNEHRRVTILFVSFTGFDYNQDHRVIEKLQHYLAAVIRVVQRYDGYLNKVDMGDKGSKYIILFGAPIVHENDEERALRCALELSILPDCLTRIGINTGFVYCGQVGSPVRQEYTVMGDAVNLSARLMQAAANGQILVSGETHRYANEMFTWQHFEPITVKGKSEPIPIYAVNGVKQQSMIHLHLLMYSLPLVGREKELQQIQHKLELVWQGQGQIIGLVGEAGLGKTRLNMETIKRGTEQGFTIYGGACESHGSNISYLVWREIWQGFFELDLTQPLNVQISDLETQLATIDPRLEQRLPLLGVLLNLPIPDNPLTRSLDTQTRTDLLKSLLLTCLQQRARSTPLLLVLEDVHWIDPLSRELLEFLGRNLATWSVFMIALYRPPAKEDHPLQWARRFPHFDEIELAEFPPVRQSS